MTSDSSPSTEHSKLSSVARSSLIMASGTLVSRILGMVRSPILLTMVVGLNSPIANAFDIANTLPNLLFIFIASGLVDAIFVPAIVRAMKFSDDGGQKFLNKLFTITLVFLSIITLVLVVLAPVVVKLFASTVAPEWYTITVMMAYWCIPQVFFYGLCAVLGQVLNARERFGPYMWVPVVNNVIAIAGFLILLWIFGSPSQEQLQNPALWDGSRSLALAIISTLGVATQALLLLWPLRQLGVRLRLDFHWRNAGFRSTGKASFWAVLNTFVSMLPTIVLTNVAAGATQKALSHNGNVAAVAGNAAYNTAYALFMVPVSLITLSIATAMFTQISHAAVERDFVRLRTHITTTTNSVAVLNYLAASMLIVLSLPIARVFIPTGSVDEIKSLAILISILAFAVVPLGLTMVFSRVNYAFEDTRGPFLASIPSHIFCISMYLLCTKLPPVHIMQGVTIAVATGTYLTLTVIMLYTNKKIGGINIRAFLATQAKLVLSFLVVTALGLGAGFFIGTRIVTSSITLSVLLSAAGGIGLSTAYLVMIKILKVPGAEVPMQLIQRFTRKLRH